MIVKYLEAKARAARYENKAEAGPAVPEALEWPLVTSPSEYLERYGPDAPRSELARRILAEQESEG
ncbi:MAG: hypothetical protein EA417_17730 [Gammaproteobacteria bacterium]|nr:MAG: hypothetical protein EA417_17730 [Gammaproteobacteria bacterium]